MKSYRTKKFAFVETFFPQDEMKRMERKPPGGKHFSPCHVSIVVMQLNTTENFDL